MWGKDEIMVWNNSECTPEYNNFKHTTHASEGGAREGPTLLVVLDKSNVSLNSLTLL